MKKGYIFLMDAIFAVILLVIGLIILSSNRTEQVTEIPLSLSLENSIDLLSSVKLSDLCDDCSCSIEKMHRLCEENEMRNRQESILDYVGELYARGNKEDAYLLIENISNEKDIFREKEHFDIELSIDDERIYPETDTSADKKKAKTLLSSRRIIFGYFENNITGAITYWGPYEVRMEIWEKQ